MTGFYKMPQPTREHMKADVAAYMRYYNLRATALPLTVICHQ